jgi:iron complex outermembrane receptor protein
MRLFKIKTRCLLMASAVMLLPATAEAQLTEGASTSAVPPGASAQESTDIGDIVVTAQRREQRGNDVGIAMNVVTGAELASAGVKQVNDLTALTTNVNIKNTLGNSVPNISIRGIGLNDYASNNNPAAGVYVDNVYLVSPAMLSFGLFDVERVEILKGPQGDLYGRNTTAGAINIISRRPSATPSADFEVGYGSYQSWHVNGAVGGALTSTLNGRFAFVTDQQDSGWVTNYVTGKRIGKIDRTAARLQLEWTPSAAFKARLSAHAGYDRSDEALYKADNNVTTTEDDPYLSKPRTAGSANDPHLDNKSLGASLTMDWNIDDNITLTSISAYEHFRRIDVADQDGTGLRQLDSTFDNKIEEATQEVRLSYSKDDLNVIGGVYYSHDTVNTRDFYLISDLFPSFGDTLGNTYRQKTEAYAGFLHGEWTFLPQLTVIAGLRYTHESKDFDNVTTFFGSNGAYTNAFPPASSTFSTSRVSGKIGLNYKPADNTLIYGTVSRGVKSGGFQGQLTFDPAAIQPFRDETVTAYEIGIKSRVLPNLQINVAAFNYQYKDAQFYGPLFDSPLGTLFGIANAGNARVRGLEGDVRWRPTPGLDIYGGVGFIDTKITKSIVAGVVEGSRLPNAPKLTLNGSIKYGWRVSDKLHADVTLAGVYQSQVAFDIVRNPPQAVEPGYFLGNAEAGVDLGDHFRVSVFGKNLFDKLYRTQSLFTSIGWTYQYGNPRTFGVNLKYKM